MFVDRVSTSGGMDHGTHHADPRVTSIGDLSRVTFVFLPFLLPVSQRKPTKEAGVNKTISLRS